MIVIDPMLATGGSLVHTVAAAASTAARRCRSPWCARSPRPRASSASRDEHLDLHVVTAAIDDHLNEHAFIVPGLGDAGDRQFGSGG